MRTINSTVESQLESGRFSIRKLIKLALGSGNYGLALSIQPITFTGLEYKALGILGDSSIEFSSGTSAQDFTLMLPQSVEGDASPEILRNFFYEDYRDRPVSIYDAYLNVDTGDLITAIEIRRGYIDRVRYTETEENGAVYELECFSRAIDYSRRNGRLANDVDQQRRSSGDRFFSHTAQTGRQQIYWGRVKT
jgi:hypothetical protein